MRKTGGVRRASCVCVLLCNHQLAVHDAWGSPAQEKMWLVRTENRILGRVRLSAGLNLLSSIYELRPQAATCRPTTTIARYDELLWLLYALAGRPADDLFADIIVILLVHGVGNMCVLLLLYGVRAFLPKNKCVRLRVRRIHRVFKHNCPSIKMPSEKNYWPFCLNCRNKLSKNIIPRY